MTTSSPSAKEPGGQTRDCLDIPGMYGLETLSQKATDFVSSRWGTLSLLGMIVAWLIAIPFAGWSGAYRFVEEIITVASFALLFLLQRSQTKDTLSLQIKLNELLAAVRRASPELINIETRSESEVRELHDRFQEVQQHGPGSHSIEEALHREEDQQGRSGTGSQANPPGGII
jgi:low affinity Fe/Cu permease